MKDRWSIHLLKRLVRLFRSIRIKITLWYTLLLALILTLFAGSIYVIQVHALEADLTERLHASTSQVAMIYTNNPTLLTSGSRQTLTRNEGEVVLIFSPQGTLLQVLGTPSHQDIVQLQAAAKQFADLHTGYQTSSRTGDTVNENKTAGIYIFSTTQIETRGQAVAILLIGLSKARTQQEEHQLLFLLLLIVPLFLLVAALGGFWLAVRAMRPVRLISHAAREISETDLSRRLHLKGQDELAELGTTFDHMLARLESAFERQRRFTSDASHELRTPLTIISWQVSQLLEERPAPEDSEQSLLLIQVENIHMTRLVNDLLTLARADAGQVSLEARDVDMSDVALEVMERIAPLARQKGVTLVCGDLLECKVTGDRLYLIQMLTNLVENAIKYTHTDIHIWIVQQEEWGKVCIKDDGMGIPAEHIPYVFERFYRVDKARTREAAQSHETPDLTTIQQGSGLGLSIAQWIAQAHAGKILVQSEVGRGSTFEVWLPLSEIAHPISNSPC